MWELVQHHAPWRDFEPTFGLSLKTPYGRLSRITLDDEKHSAYGSIANLNATIDNDEDISTGETVPIPWQEAQRLLCA